MGTPRSVCFHTLGCKLNFSETSTIKKQFQQAGFTINEWDNGADIFVLNTCSVTDFADRKCRKAVRDAKKNNPSGHIVVIGCYAQLKPKEIADIEGVDLVLGAKEKFNLLQHIEQFSISQDVAIVNAGDVYEANSFIHAYSLDDRTRTFLKVQDGCNYSCSFCTIPLARGKSRSDTIENVINNINTISQMGKKEIVLTGVNLGDFGNGTEVIEGVRPKKEAMFIDLMEAIEQTNGIHRFRISSIEPNLCTNEVIDHVASSSKFVPHFHIPLQSGSPDILKKMQRRYNRNLYKSRIEYIKEKMPHACIGVDVIVGFPGETKAHFLETFQFLESLDISYLHVFTYSERSLTKANEMEGVVDMHERRLRNKTLRKLSEQKKNAFYQNHLGTCREVLVEESKKDGFLSGYTDNYIRIQLPYQENLLNQVVTVQLDNIIDDGLVKANLLEPHLTH